MKNFLITCYFLLSGWLSLTGQVKFVNEFLNIGAGARSHGMFGSVVANVDDASAGYWNTAGLTQIDVPLQVSAMHANWFGGIANYDYLTIAKKIGIQRDMVVGLSVIRMGIDNIPNTINLIGADGSVDFDRITTFSASDYAILLSFAKKINAQGNFSLGGNIKIINRNIGDFGTAWGIGADLSAQWRGDHLSFGLSGRDITTTFNSWVFNLSEQDKEVFAKTGNEIPLSSTESTLPRLIGGVAYHGIKNKISYLIEGDINLSTDGAKAQILSGKNLSISPSFGVEIGYADKVFVRAGIGNIQSVINPANFSNSERSIEFQPNVGLGIKLGRLKVDYALTNIGSVSGVLVSHLFSLTLDFNARKDTGEQSL